MEIHGHKLHKYPPIRVGDVDQRAGRVLLRDTKNRSDHKLLPSRQALEIAKRNCAGRKADEPLFPIVRKGVPKGRQRRVVHDVRGDEGASITGARTAAISLAMDCSGVIPCLHYFAPARLP